MSNKKKNSSKPASPRKTSSKSSNKPVAIIALGIVGALVLAVVFSQGGGSTDEVTPLSGDARQLLAAAEARHVRGGENAVVTLIEFGDFQCPACGSYHPVLKELLRRFPEELEIEFHHLPLVTIHPNAMPSALAAEAASLQGRFWEMNDLLYENQQAWSTLANAEDAFLAYAQTLGLDSEQFMNDMRSPEVRDRVLEDVALANALRLAGTPSFFVNDVEIPLPPSYSDFERIIYDAILAD